MEYFWELVQRDGTTTRIPPGAVDVVKKRLQANQPINTRTAVIPANEVKSFKQSNVPFGQQPLLDAVAHTFNEPVDGDDGGIVFRWVKKQITHDKWNRHYSNIPSYKFMFDDGNEVTMGYKLPIHLIDERMVTYCNDDDIVKLEAY
jgi:hypothetical protein